MAGVHACIHAYIHPFPKETSRHFHLTHPPTHPSIDPHPASGLACTVTLSMHTFSRGLFFASTGTRSNSPNTRMPSSPTTCANTVLRPSRCGAAANRMKNCEPLVPGPLFAMLTMPRAWWRSAGRISSSKGPPQIEVPDLEGGASGLLGEGAPVCIMKVGIRRWMGVWL